MNIDQSNVEMYAMMYMDGELTHEEANELHQFIANHPEYSTLLSDYEAVKLEEYLVDDLALINSKNLEHSLLKNNNKWYGSLIAVAGVLLLSSMLYYNINKDVIPKNVIKDISKPIKSSIINKNSNIDSIKNITNNISNKAKSNNIINNNTIQKNHEKDTPSDIVTTEPVKYDTYTVDKLEQPLQYLQSISINQELNVVYLQPETFIQDFNDDERTRTESISIGGIPVKADINKVIQWFDDLNEKINNKVSNVLETEIKFNKSSKK